MVMLMEVMGMSSFLSLIENPVLFTETNFRISLAIH